MDMAPKVGIRIVRKTCGPFIFYR